MRTPIQNAIDQASLAEHKIYVFTEMRVRNGIITFRWVVQFVPKEKRKFGTWHDYFESQASNMATNDMQFTYYSQPEALEAGIEHAKKLI